MVKLNFKIGVLVYLASLFPACTPVLYIPNQLNMPMATKPDVFKGSFYGGTGGLGGHASYAIDSHLVLFANGCINNFVPKASNQIYSYDAGGGYFGEIGENLNIEILGGLGYGRSDANVSNNLAFRTFPTTEKDILHATYERSFLQFDIVKTHRNGNQFGFGVRLAEFSAGSFYYHRILTENRTGYPPYVIEDSTLQTLNSGWLIEPEINFKAKLGAHSFFNTAFGFSVPTIHQNPYSSFSSVFSYFIFTIGLGFEI